MKFESEFAQRHLRQIGCGRIGAYQRCLIADFEDLHFFLCAHYFFPYLMSRARPVRFVVLSPLVFLILSMPRETTPLFVQYSSAVSSVIRPCSKSSRTAMSKVFHPKAAADSMMS